MDGTATAHSDKVGTVCGECGTIHEGEIEVGTTSAGTLESGLEGTRGNVPQSEFMFPIRHQDPLLAESV